MSIINDSSSTDSNDDHTIPLDIRYTNFLAALSDISNETMRDRCHKYWTSLYRYFDHSITNEQALIIEEKRIQEILHRLDMDRISQQSEVAYQVRHLLQRGHEVLADLHTEYKHKKESLTNIKQNIANLEKQKSKTSNLSLISSSKSLNHLNETVQELKSEINNLYKIRETYEIELNNLNVNYFSNQIQVYHIQQINHKLDFEYKQIYFELTFNRQENFQLNKQLKQYTQNIDHLVQNERFNSDLNFIKQQIINEENRFIELKKLNREMNNSLIYHISLLKMQESKQNELNIENKNSIEMINKKHQEIENEQHLQQQISRIQIQLKQKLKRKEELLSIKHRQEQKFKNQILDLEHQRDAYSQHQSLSSSLNNLTESNETLEQTIQNEINHRLKLTIVYHNLKSETLDKQTTINEYADSVKYQREKIIYYEKLHDKWIIHMNSNRTRLINLFQRIERIQQCTTKTNEFLQQLNQIKFSSKSNLLIFFNKINRFIQQRREKNDIESNINPINESKNSLYMKLNHFKQILRLNQQHSNQIKQNLLLIKKHSSIVSKQILTLNQKRLELNQYFDLFEKNILIKDREIDSLFKKYNQLKSLIDLTNRKSQEYNIQKQNFISFLLRKQHLILIINKQIQINENKLRKFSLSNQQLFNKIQEIKTKILFEIKQKKTFDRHEQIMKIHEEISHLRKQLLEYKKKTNDYQHRINRRHLVRQILTQFDNKSIPNENYKHYRISLQEKFSSIIYRLICKIHYNTILHKHFDLLMQKMFLLSTVHQQSLNNICKFPNNFIQLNKQLQSSLAEFYLLKTEILLSKKLYLNTKFMLEKTKAIIEKKQQELNCVPVK